MLEPTVVPSVEARGLQQFGGGLYGDLLGLRAYFQCSIEDGSFGDIHSDRGYL